MGDVNDDARSFDCPCFTTDQQTFATAVVAKCRYDNFSLNNANRMSKKMQSDRRNETGASTLCSMPLSRTELILAIILLRGFFEQLIMLLFLLVSRLFAEDRKN